jgi:DNA modification methylase
MSKHKKISIDKILINPNNPRLIKDDKFKKLCKSIQEFPEMLELRPIVVNKDMIVLGGNMRLKACQEIGLTEVPIIVAENLTEEQQREFLIKDNVSGGEWDWDILANEWEVEQLNEWGLDVPINLETELEAVEDDFNEEPPEEPITILGDLYEIGEHRLLCGDSTDSDAVAKLMNGQKADMVFTDPPYGMSLDADFSKMGSDTIKAGRKHENIKNDDKQFDPSIIFTFFNYCDDIILFGADYYSDYIPNKNEGSWLIWDKRVEDKYDKIIGSSFETIFSKRKVKREIIRYEYVSWANRMADKVNGIKPHPTMKPIGMLNILLDKFTGSFIADLFLGSGSTMVASHQLKRKCYGMELDPKYCDVIVKRMIKLDPSIKVKRNGQLIDNKQWHTIE